MTAWELAEWALYALGAIWLLSLPFRVYRAVREAWAEVQAKKEAWLVNERARIADLERRNYQRDYVLVDGRHAEVLVLAQIERLRDKLRRPT